MQRSNRWPRQRYGATAVKIFAARAKGYKWLANLLGIEESKCSIHLLDVDQCKAAVAIIERFELERRSKHTSEDTPRD